MPDTAFVILSVLVPGLLCGTAALALAWWQRRARHAVSAGSEAPWVALVAWAIAVVGFVVAFLLEGDFRSAVATRGLRTPGFFIALVPLALIPAACEAFLPGRWRLLAWVAAAAVLAGLLWPAFHWAGKDPTWLWYGGGVAAALAAAAILSLALRGLHWWGLAGWVFTLLAFAPFALTYRNSRVVMIVDLLTAPLVAITVGGALLGLRILPRLAAWPVLLAVPAGAVMLRAQALTDQVVWGPLILFLLAPLPLAVVRCSPLTGRARTIAVVAAAVLWVGTAVGASGWSKQVYDGLGEDSADDAGGAKEQYGY